MPPSYIHAYGRTYYYYKTYSRYGTIRYRAKKMWAKGKKTFIRKTIKGIVFPAVHYELYVTRR